MGENVEEETHDEAMKTTTNNREVGEGGEEDHEKQDMDCEPFKANEGPSDDDTAAEQEQQQDKPVTTKKQTIRPTAIRKSSRTHRAMKLY